MQVSSLHEWGELIHAIGWPAVAIVGLIGLRQPIGSFIEKLAARIATAGKVSITRDGLSLEGQIAENATRIETLEVSQGVAQARMANVAPRAAAKLVAPPAGSHAAGGGAATAPATTIPPPLADEAAAYRAMAQPDYATRVGSKNQLADRMAAYVLDHAIPHDLLAGSTDEGIIVALATAIVANPGAGDAARLLQAAPRVTRKHVAYRVVLAASQLLARHLVEPAQLPEMRRALERFRAFADAPLSRAIDRAVLTLA